MAETDNFIRKNNSARLSVAPMMDCRNKSESDGKSYR